MLVWNVRKFIVRFVMGVLYRVMFMSHMKWFFLCYVSVVTLLRKTFVVVSVFHILFFINILVRIVWFQFFCFLSQLCVYDSIVSRVIVMLPLQIGVSTKGNFCDTEIRHEIWLQKLSRRETGREFSVYWFIGKVLLLSTEVVLRC